MTNKCSVENCDKKIIARKYCMTHYRRILRNGTLELKSENRPKNCIKCGKELKVSRKGLCGSCASAKCREIILEKDIFIDIERNPERSWKNYSPKELDIYIDKIWGYYHKKGFPYNNYSNEYIIDKFYKFKEFDSKRLLQNGIIKRCGGQMLGELWQFFPHYLEISCNDKKTPMECFNNENLFKKVIRNRLKTGTYIRDSGIRKAFRNLAGIQSVSNFRPSVARCIYDNFLDGSVVYDFSSGFGGRLIGALASDKVKHYIGVEPSNKTYAGLIRIKNLFLELNKRIDIYKMGSEDFIQKEYVVDMCFSSPPYYNLEKYSDEETQSYVKYDNYNDWINIFVDRTVKNSISMLKVNGLFIVNIASIFKYKNLATDYLNKCLENGLVLEQTINMLLTAGLVSKSKGVNYKSESIYILRKLQE